MPLKRKTRAENEDDVDEIEELEAKDLEESDEEETDSSKKEPKINFEYQDPEEEPEEEIKKEETLGDLANKYRDPESDETEEEVESEPQYHHKMEEAPEEPDSDSKDEEIPQMRAHMPTSGIYSEEDIRRSNSDLHQSPYMKSSFSNHNDNFRPKSGSGGKSSKLHFVILGLIGLAVLGSAVYLLKYQFKQPKPIATPSPSPVVQSTPSPSPTPVAIDRSKFTVRVLNGTGKSGLAASISTKLKGLGYKIDKTGNAPSIDQTTIKAKTGNDDLIKQITTDLASDYSASSSSASLKTNDTADAEVTLGSK